ncbi:MAG: 2-iminoacetate synthase ThiH [Verrucomicrobia bacterium]|nr:2-iminoacetate synthase ThiH [Verrucomicrobiota bacterium]
MAFVSTYNSLALGKLTLLAEGATAADVERALARGERRGLEDFAALVSPAGAEFLEAMARESHALTVKHFGRAMRLFAPLYLSNECVNVCEYCGFSRDNPILRTTLTVEQVMAEARHLLAEGFRNILLVAGEHPKFVSTGYLRDCVAALHAAGVPSINIEVGPLETEDYRQLVMAGCEGLVLYQETYNRDLYRELHTAGPKKDFDWRLETVERGYAAGMRRLGIGALLGLWRWREDAIALAAHAEYLLKNCWRSQLTISLPRLRPAAGEFEPPHPISDRDLVQMVCALRLIFPRVGLVLSTRESARLRDGLFPLGITLISAGSHTEPGGYTGAGSEKLHVTERGRTVEVPVISSEGEHGMSSVAAVYDRRNPTPQSSDGGHRPPLQRATEQFTIADERSAAEVAEKLHALGYEAVWKDWDPVLSESCGMWEGPQRPDFSNAGPKGRGAEAPPTFALRADRVKR